MKNTSGTIEAESSAGQLRHVRVVLNELATLANLTDQHGDLIIGHMHGDARALELEVLRLRGVVRQLGHLADFGSALIDGDEARGGVAEWLVPTMGNDASISAA